MIINNDAQVNLNKTLEELWTMSMFDVAFDGNPDYVEKKDELMKLFSEDVKHSNSLIDTLDFSKSAQAHVLKFVPKIVENLDTLEDQVMFIKHLKFLQEKFPNVNFSRAIFYSELYYKF